MKELILSNDSETDYRANFVEPYYIEALGCDGLTAADIAKSLGIDATVVRQKLRDPKFAARIKAQGFQMVEFSMAGGPLGTGFMEIALDVPGSKFFVGKYNNLTGDAYLAFLLKLEQHVAEFNTDVKADPIMRSLAEGLRLRQNQMRQEERLKLQETKTTILEDRVGSIDEALLDSQLSQVQKSLLKASIDARAKSLGSIQLAGSIQRDIKAKFGLNRTNDKWYHLAQRHYEEANNFVGRWGY